MGAGGTTVSYGVLGPLAVHGPDGRPVALRGELQRRLVGALLLHAGRSLGADALADLLWGEDLPADVPGAVQTHVSRIRRVLPAGNVVTTGAGYHLDLAGTAIDRDRFDALVASASGRRAADPGGALADLDEALALWRGPAWDGFADWDAARADASRLDELHVRAREERLGALVDLGRPEEAVAGLRALAAEHPLREQVQALLLVALYRAGRQADALRAYEEHRRRLADELGLDPSPALRDLERAILDHALEGPPRAAGPAPNPVRRSAARLFGRDAEVDALAGLVARCRVVTLTGPGGVGKTTLALEVARRAQAGGPVAVCELASLGAGGDVARAVATTLGVEAAAGADLARRVADALSGTATLLVLDNCEHVADGAARLVEHVVGATDDVVVLATSRERLAVAGEHLHLVAPLGDADAVALFVDRARAVRPDFSPDLVEGDDLLAICRGLDGLPLALELAAARAQALSVGEIAAALGRRFDLLTGGRRAEERHRSLADAVRWSFDLLDDDERALAERLAVFAGGCTVASAAAVSGHDPARAAALVARLVERSLLTVTSPGGPTRYRMLETLREYGLGQLERRGELAAARRAHADHLVAFAVDQRAAMTDPGLAAGVLTALEAELADLRAAHAVLLDVGDGVALSRLHRALYWYGSFALRAEVFAWAESSLASLPAGPWQADLLDVVAYGRWQRGDPVGAMQATEEGLALAPAGSPLWASLTAERGNLEARRGRLDLGLRLVVAADTAMDDPIDAAVNGFQRLLFRSLLGDGTAAADAARWADASLAAGNPLVAAWACYAAGELAAGHDADAARHYLDAALGQAVTSGCRFVAGTAGVTAASVDARAGRHAVAARRYLDLVDLWRLGSMRPVEATMARAVAELVGAAGDAAAAATLHGAVRSSAVAALTGPDAERQAALARDLANRLGDAAFTAAVAEGARLDHDEVLALAATALADVAARA